MHRIGFKALQNPWLDLMGLFVGEGRGAEGGVKGG